MRRGSGAVSRSTTVVVSPPRLPVRATHAQRDRGADHGGDQEHAPAPARPAPPAAGGRRPEGVRSAGSERGHRGKGIARSLRLREDRGARAGRRYDSSGRPEGRLCPTASSWSRTSNRSARSWSTRCATRVFACSRAARGDDALDVVATRAGRPRRARHHAARASTASRSASASGPSATSRSSCCRPAARSSTRSSASSSAPTTTSPSPSPRASWSRGSRRTCAGRASSPTARRRCAPATSRSTRPPARCVAATTRSRSPTPSSRSSTSWPSSPRRVFTREELMNHLWKGNFYGDLRSVDVHVRHLRQKVEDDAVGADPDPHRARRRLRLRRGGRAGAVRARRAFGLQGWLVAALLAVGLAASLAILLVVLPTLESSVRTDRAKREAQELRSRAARRLGERRPAVRRDAQDDPGPSRTSWPGRDRRRGRDRVRRARRTSSTGTRVA